MTKQGRLTKDKFGHNMPADAPLYASPPIYYKDAESLGITYETDLEAALDLLPEGLTIDTPAMATLLILRYPFSTLGPYEEAILGIPCSWENEPRLYIPHIVVNSDIPQAAGREIWGYPKKMAHITLEKEMDLVYGSMERPKGHKICSAGIRLERPVEVAEPVSESWSAALKIIPSPEKNTESSLAELVETYSKMTVVNAWQGTGWINYESRSMVDPWHKLEVKNILDATYRVYHQELGHGKIIKRY